MHDKVPLRAALAELAACPVFLSVCDGLRKLALEGVRVPYSSQAVQRPGFHGSSVGIHTLLERMPGPLSHYFAARELSFPRSTHAHDTSPDVVAVVAAVSQHWRAGDVELWREARLQTCAELFDRLAPWDARLRGLMPPSVLEAGGTVPVATVAACVRALRWPHTELPLCLLGGFEIIGDVPGYGGVFPLAERVRAGDIHALDHAAENKSIERRLWARFRTGGAAMAAQMAALMAVSEKAVSKGYAFWTNADECDRMFGPGAWRALERFGVPQESGLRACDNAKAGQQNECSSVGERLRCETADFPAVMADLFFEAIGPAAKCRGGTDDQEKAYWRVANSQPEFSIVIQLDPRGGGQIRLLRVPGHCFGLLSAVTNYNSVSEFVTHGARRLLAVPCGHYFDDFATIHPQQGADSAKAALAWLSARLGFPLTKNEQKNKAMLRSLTFVGVVTDMSRFDVGWLSYELKEGRALSISNMLRGFLESRQISPSDLSSVAGKLQFAVSQLYGGVGRAALHDISHADPGDISEDSSGLRAAMEFFVALLGLLRGRKRRLGRAQRCLVLVWSDAMYGRGSGAAPVHSSGVGFVVYDVASGERWSAGGECPAGIIASFTERLTHIGQLELLAELLPYLATPRRFAGADVIHFVDNTSAIYASIKGASSSADSARIVHMLHLLLAALDICVWFEYVPSKENIADAPSRGDMELLTGLGARRLDLVFPPTAALASPCTVFAYVQDLLGTTMPTGGAGVLRTSGASRAAKRRRAGR